MFLSSENALNKQETIDMNSEENRESVRSAVDVLLAISKAVEELKEVPSGHLYSVLMNKIKLEDYEKCLDILNKAGVVSKKGDLVVWVDSKSIQKELSDKLGTKGCWGVKTLRREDLFDGDKIREDVQKFFVELGLGRVFGYLFEDDCRGRRVTLRFDWGNYYTPTRTYRLEN